MKKPFYKKWWFWVLIVIAIIGITSNGGNGSSNNTDTGTQSQISSQVEEQISYEAVNLQTMLDDLEGNAMKAEKTYQNKYVEVTGKIANFDSDGSYISIKPVNADEWSLDTVMCYIKDDAQTQILMEKEIGDTVTIKGKVKSIGEVLGYSLDIKEVK